MNQTSLTSQPDLEFVDQNAEYTQFLGKLEGRFTANLESSGPAIFSTDAGELFETYLAAIPLDRQYYNCHACRRFINTYQVRRKTPGFSHGDIRRGLKTSELSID